MPQSLVRNYLHITFSTKSRQPLIDKPIMPKLFAYMGGICRNLKCNPVIIGGYYDHVHILCTLSPKIPLMKLLEEIKSHSSKWIKTQGEKYKSFYWQSGYGAFSVNPADSERVISYISNQEEHHRKKSFQEEYVDFLKEFEVDYDPRYLWD
jgi:putative transposase